MTDEQRNEIMRQQAAGMRAVSAEELSKRQAEWANDMRPRGPLTVEEMSGLRNFYGQGETREIDLVPNHSATLWVRIRRWFVR